jgi:predicted N-acyltransferase
MRDGALLVGAMALMIEHDRWRGMDLRTLVMISDPSTLNVRSDLLVRPGCEAAVVNALAEHLHDTCSEWDRLRFDSVPESSALRAHWPAFVCRARLLRPVDELRWRLHRVSVQGTWHDYLATHTAHSREHLRREHRKMAALASVVVEFATTVAAVEAGVEAFFEIEPRSGKERRENYSPLTAEVKGYYRVLFHNLAKQGRALVVVARDGDRPIASNLIARLDDRIFTLNELFDEAYRRHYLGHCIRARIVEWAWTAGLSEVDFNGYGEHLERWRTRPADHHRLSAISPSAFGHLFALHRSFFVPWAHRLLPQRCLPALPPAERPGDRGLSVASDSQPARLGGVRKEPS